MTPPHHRDPFRNLTAWNPHHRHGHLPTWLRQRIRATLTAENRWHCAATVFQCLPGDLFDHWGSIPCPAGGRRPWIYAMPYSRPDDLARAFAARYGLALAAIVRPAPWHPVATCYLFAPGDAEEAPPARREGSGGHITRKTRPGRS